MKKKTDRKKVVEKLDRVFSQYIRLRSAKHGDAACVTCGVVKPWKEQQAGHYESRGHFGTRWDERNVNVQCYGCNVMRKGNYPNYALYMIRHYGNGILQELEWQANNAPKMTTFELEVLIDKYTELVKSLTN